ncbi:hypothetical protein [Massilia sp. DWR3-1-1]|uniref:hypothetical protein n=1 Tax=Massilia sp. DWR3-1-1 TaxID=2804559 RepID=UPI003CFB1286
MLLRVTGGRCDVLSAAADSFSPIGDGQLSAEAMDLLARDLRRRLEQGFGGSARLKHAMRAQRIDLRSHPPALRRAFASP